MKLNKLLIGVGCVARFIPEDKLPEYFKKAAKIIDSNELGVFSLFGMTFREILEMMQNSELASSSKFLVEMGNRKMTREEAIDKCKNLHNWPDILEALGLIKFDKKAEVKMLFEMDLKGRRIGGVPMNLGEIGRF